MATRSTRAAWARRALRDAGIEVTQEEAEREIARRGVETSPLWCGRCATITPHVIRPRTLVDRCERCGPALGDG